MDLDGKYVTNTYSLFSQATCSRFLEQITMKPASSVGKYGNMIRVLKPEMNLKEIQINPNKLDFS